MQELINFLSYIFNNNYFVLAMDIVSFALKTFIFVSLSIHTYIKSKKKLPSFFLLLAIFSGALIDLGWISTFSNRMHYPLFDFKIHMFLCRLGWAFLVLQYHCMVLLLETLLTKNYKLLLRRNIFLIMCSSFFILFFTFFPIAAWHLAAKPDRPPIEPLMKHICSIYLLFILIPISLWNIFYHLQSKKIPIIIQRQCYTLLYTLIIPYFLSDFINMNPIGSNFFNTTYIQNQAFTGFSTLILTYLLYFCMQRILNVRFLNLKKSVNSLFIDIKFNEYFKEVLGYLSEVKYTYEIPQIVQSFLHKALHINEKKVDIIIKPNPENDEKNDMVYDEPHSIYHVFKTLDNTFSDPKNEFFTYLKKEHVLVFDDIDFANFYDNDPFLNNVLHMMASINCAILVPIFHKEELLAYMIIYFHARKERLYSHSDKDALVVFANYVGSIMFSIQNNQFERVIEQNRILTENLYFKTHQINYLKESIKSCFDRSRVKTICLFLYKNKEFIALNQEALQLFNVDLNQHEGHPLTNQCKRLVTQALAYNTTQTSLIKSDNEEPILIVALPHLEHKSVTMMITHPDIADLIGKHLLNLPSMDDWDYILYLQTTKTGLLINNLLPGWSKQMIEYKIDILKNILSKKALFIQCTSSDISLALDLLHKSTERKELKILDPVKDIDCETALFGINPLYGKIEEPLLKKLNQGIIFINNVHKLSTVTQEKLSIYIDYGHFTKFKSDIFIKSDVLILMSSPLPCSQKNDAYAYNLSESMKTKHLYIPSPALLNNQDYEELIEGYCAQALNNHTIQKIFAISDYEKRKLIMERPLSLTHLKEKIINLLTNKNKNTAIEHKIYLDNTFSLADHTLAEAGKLGKNALKDHHIVSFLWHHFEKNQNKIALFLGVNRSSVNRRIKEFNLT